MNNLLVSFFTPSQTAIIITVAVVGVVLIVLNIVLAHIFNKRGVRKLFDLMLQQQREILMQQLEQMRSGEITVDEQPAVQSFFAAPQQVVQPAAAVEEQTVEPVSEPELVEEPEEIPRVSEELADVDCGCDEDDDEEELAVSELEEEDETKEIVEEVVINGIVMRYNRSFTARVTQASDENKERYSQLKNYLLSFKGVKNRISWKRESFRTGRNTFACFTVRGKSLCLCLATDPARFNETKYKVIDLSVRSPKSKQPCMYRIINDRRVKYAKEIIDMLMAELGLSRDENYAQADYRLPYRTTEELIEDGHIKVVGDSAVIREVAEEVAADSAVAPSEEVETPVQEIIETPVESVEEVEETHAEEATEEVVENLAEETPEEVPVEEVTEEVVETPAEETEEAAPVQEVIENLAEETSEEVIETPVEEIEETSEEEAGISAEDVSVKMTDEEAENLVEEEIVKKPVRKYKKSAIVNIGSLSKHFEAGERVDIDSLREKKLIGKDVGEVKILAKGSLNKPLIVEADDFSLVAVKMIILTGGRAIRRKYSD